MFQWSKGNDVLGTMNRGNAAESGLCTLCRADCMGKCETWSSCLKGRQMLYPRDFGLVTAGRVLHAARLMPEVKELAVHTENLRGRFVERKFTIPKDLARHAEPAKPKPAGTGSWQCPRRTGKPW